ncbi:isochorismate synthase [Gordonia sp. DT30]|uniref:isochorismate synthase n=1 Tax=unclassified Gordonia (in: high G+C Gram-positive bacteria) TaxID=2657482 RepID=UPI003CFA194B
MSGDPESVDNPAQAPFVLSRPHGTVRAEGIIRRFTEVDAAIDDLRTGRADTVVGALPFDPAGTSALMVPRRLRRDLPPLAGRSPARHTLDRFTEIPDAATHRDRVRRAVAAITAGDLDKVVLARTVRAVLDSPAEVTGLLDALAHGNSEHNAFAVDTGPGWLLGASPELLLRKAGREVTCRPYAGSAPRFPDPVADREAREKLAASGKDHREHAFVVDHLRRRLAPLCDEITIPDAPQLLSTGEMWHLATPIRAHLTDPDLNALELALALSPTPAVCGTPTDVAAQFIRDHEEPRGNYAGAVGWADAHGDGEWMVTIRCLEIDSDGRSFRTWAGGGIVADSDPDAELAETTAKLRTVLRALGVDGS